MGKEETKLKKLTSSWKGLGPEELGIIASLLLLGKFEDTDKVLKVEDSLSR